MTEEQIDGFKKLLAAPTGGPSVPKMACLCGSFIDVRENALSRHSGIVNYQECLCPDCRKEFANFARVVCLGCKSLQAFLTPQRAKTGYVFLARAHVHVVFCPACRPGAAAAPVLEHLQFCRGRGQPTNVDADIVQEAEQKYLQGKVEADKLRGELKATFPEP